MSDYTSYNQGTSGKGIIIGLLVIALFVAGLAFLGANGTPVDPNAVPAAGEEAPAAIEQAPAVVE